MAVQETPHGFRWRRSPDPISHVDGVKIGMRQKSIHGFQADMVGIQKIGLVPAQSLDGGIGRRAALGGFGADGGMFAIGFVPNRHNIEACARRAEAGLQLRLSLPREAGSHSKGIFPKRQKMLHD